MKYKLIAALFVFLLVLTAHAAVLAAPVRIGLESRFKNLDALSVVNKTITVGFEENGLFAASCEIIADGMAFAPADFTYIRLDVVYDAIDSAAAMAATLKGSYSAIPALEQTGRFAVWLAFQSEAEAVLESALLPFPGSVVPSSSKRVVLKSGETELLVFGGLSNPQFTAEDYCRLSNERRYRGVIEISRNTGKLTAVNVLSMDEYLFGVIPSEMPSSWPAEALKAQAVAARTYAFGRVNYHSADHYDLCDTTHCQVYLGVTNEAVSAEDAVNSTSGLMIYYNKKLAGAYYFASSGGYTEASENVWTSAEPYLRAVPDLQEIGAKQWTRSFTLAELTALLSVSDPAMGTVTGVSVVSSPTSGRVQELRIAASGGTKILSKEAIRTFFAASSGGSLDSRNFIVSGGGEVSSSFSITDGISAVMSDLKSLFAVSDSQSSALGGDVYALGADGTPVRLIMPPGSESLGVTFVGKGAGHGVGLSQCGARGMATAGSKFDEILKYYYTGVTIEP